MTIHLTPEQERRLRAVLGRGAYKSVEEVVEAALTAVEQRTVRRHHASVRFATAEDLLFSPVPKNADRTEWDPARNPSLAS